MKFIKEAENYTRLGRMWKPSDIQNWKGLLETDPYPIKKNRRGVYPYDSTLVFFKLEVPLYKSFMGNIQFKNQDVSIFFSSFAPAHPFKKKIHQAITKRENNFSILIFSYSHFLIFLIFSYSPILRFSYSPVSIFFDSHVLMI